MPETLLKKRKSQEKERAEKAEQRDARKKVSRHYRLRPVHNDEGISTLRD